MTTDSIKLLIDKSKDYLETKIELTKLKTIDKSADVLSAVVVMVAMLFIGFLLVLFVSLAAAIVGGFFAILLLVIYVQREKWIKNPISNGLITKMLK